MRFEAGESEAGRRLDRILKKILKGASLSFIYKTIRKDVKVNGKRVPPETLLTPGDIVEIFLPDDQISASQKGTVLVAHQKGPIVAAKEKLAVIFEDENVLVVNKPYGLLTHGDAIEKKDTLANRVISYLSQAGVYVPGGTRAYTPAPASRLDRNTTGLVLFGKNYPAARDLATMMGRSDCIEKAYLTVVKGRITDSMRLSARMVRDSDKNVTKVLPDAAAEGREMITEVCPLSAGKGYTLVEARLLTGRTHQIRVQLAEAGFPIIGDRKYGNKETNRKMSQKYGLQAQLLHACRLRVTSGIGSLEYLTGETFRAQPPAEFSEIAEDLECSKTETEN